MTQPGPIRGQVTGTGSAASGLGLGFFGLSGEAVVIRLGGVVIAS